MYAYLDKYEILHVVEDEKDAVSFSKNEKYLPYDSEAKYGYPVIDGKDLFVYLRNDVDRTIDIYVGGNEGSGVKAKDDAYPEIKTLVRELAAE